MVLVTGMITVHRQHLSMYESDRPQRTKYNEDVACKVRRNRRNAITDRESLKTIHVHYVHFMSITQDVLKRSVSVLNTAR